MCNEESAMNLGVFQFPETSGVTTTGMVPIKKIIIIFIHYILTPKNM